MNRCGQADAVISLSLLFMCIDQAMFVQVARSDCSRRLSKMSSDNQYKHDVFVSYATVDDRPAKRGWVSAFVRSLHESLDAAFGYRDHNRIWWDRSNIDEEALLTEQIRTKAQSSACMVIILSQGYVKSKWCRQELAAFRQASMGNTNHEGRLFLIDIGNLSQADRPTEFADKRGRHFFVQPLDTFDPANRTPLGFPTPDPENKDHAEFFAQVDQLAKDIYSRVSELGGGTPVSIPPKPHSEVTVFVAESADDVADQREQVVRFLSDYFRVVPSIDDPLPARWDEWERLVNKELYACSLFVQIVGALSGRKIAGSDQKLVIAQYLKAKAADRRIVTWRSSDPEFITDPQLKELATTAEFSGPLVEFMTEIKRIATPVPPLKVIERPESLDDDCPMVFIQADVSDNSQAKDLSELLSNLNCFVTTPLSSGTPQEIREDLEANLLECDGLILLYGQTQSGWVRTQFRALPRALSQRRKQQPPRPLKALAVCLGNPPNKPHPGVQAPGLVWIDLSVELHREQLASWVSTIRTRGTR